MASSLLIKKSVSAMLTAVILVISMAVSVSAESGTAFSYTLEEETVIADYEIPKGNFPESRDEHTSPETGDDSNIIIWLALAVKALLAILHFSKGDKRDLRIENLTNHRK